MSNLIDDSIVDAIEVIWEESPHYSGTRVVNAPAELRMIQDFLSTPYWKNLVRFIAPGVLYHHGRVAEYSGFTFQSDLDPDDEPFEGVQMFDPIDTIYISEGAFGRLMSRFFNTIIEGVTRYQKQELHEAWWPEFMATTRQVEAQAGGDNRTGPNV